MTLNPQHTPAVDDTLNWTSPDGAISIPLSSIICVIPSPNPPLQRVIYLASASGDEDSNANPQIHHLDIPPSSDSESKLLSLSPQTLLPSIPPHLQAQPPNPITVIISTKSGTGTAEQSFKTLISPFLSSLSVDFKTHTTTSAESISNLCRDRILPIARAGLSQTIILLSGDGGVLDILEGFYRDHQIQSQNQNEQSSKLKPPTISLFPCGTGNALASSLNLISARDALKALVHGNPAPLPVFKISFSKGWLVTDEGRGRVSLSETAASQGPSGNSEALYGAVVASWGLHAALVADSDTAEYRKFGSERFKMVAKELLTPADGGESHRFRGRISLTVPVVDDAGTGAGEKKTRDITLSEEEHMYVLTSMVPRLEKDFLISPASTALSGMMHFLRFGPTAPDEAMRFMGLAYAGGGHVDEDAVMYEEVRRVKIEFDEVDERWRRVCVDGKIVAVEEGGWIVVEREGRELLEIVR